MAKRTVRSTLSAAGNGILNAAVLLADLGPMTRMTEIELEIDKLQQEYAQLNSQLEADRRRPTPYVKK